MQTKNFSEAVFFFIHLVLVIPLCVRASTPRRNFVHVPLKMSWVAARQYCREHHVDLATFTSEEESEELQVPCTFWSQCWIGLYKGHTEAWSWSDGEDVSFTDFSYFDYYIDPANEHCVAMAYLWWYVHSCDKKFEFLCYDFQCHDRLILVREAKTWEEALEHCMALDTDAASSSVDPERRYTLPHIDCGFGDTSVARRVALHAQTEEVWVGLRFLAGHWLWVNGAPLREQLPACPRPGSHCGAMSKTGQLLPEKDCEERRNFLCATRKQSA